jgi:hypothetical protein
MTQLSLTLKFLIYYIGESSSNPPSVVLIQRVEYELGFQGYLQGGGQGPAYIGRSLQRDPLDQPDLRNGVDATLRGGGGTF